MCPFDARIDSLRASPPGCFILLRHKLSANEAIIRKCNGSLGPEALAPTLRLGFGAVETSVFDISRKRRPLETLVTTEQFWAVSWLVGVSVLRFFPSCPPPLPAFNRMAPR